MKYWLARLASLTRHGKMIDRFTREQVWIYQRQIDINRQANIPKAAQPVPPTLHKVYSPGGQSEEQRQLYKVYRDQVYPLSGAGIYGLAIIHIGATHTAADPASHSPDLLQINLIRIRIRISEKPFLDLSSFSCTDFIRI